MLNKNKVRELIILCFLLLVVSCNKSSNDTAMQKNPPVRDDSATLTNLGNEQWRMGNYQEALNYFTRAYEKVKASGDEKETATLLNNLGLVHWRLENNTAAMECYTEAAAIAEKIGMKRLLGLTHTNRALILKEQRDFKAAFAQNNEAIDIFRELGEPRDLAIAYNNQGQIYRFSGAFDPALKYYLLSLEECKKINYTEGMATAYQNLSTVYAKQGNKEKALLAGHKCLKLSYKVKSKVRISEGLRELSRNYDLFNVQDSALYYFKKHYDVEKEVMEANQSNLLSQYQANLGIEVKNLRIKNLQNEKEIANNRLLLTAVSVIIVLLISAFFIYRYLSIIRFRKKQLEMQLQNSLQLIQVKEEELKTYIIDLTHKNNIINKLQEPVKDPAKTDYDVNELLEQKIFTDDGWDKFKGRFKAIYPDFFRRIKHSGIAVTEAEVRILVLMRLQLNGNDMGSILGISPQSVRACKMRLKKKLQPNGYESVEQYLQHIIS
ncbi:tetratricopeptide repeat protein [Flavobacterium sp. Sd200]|uniref:tetratricopeptide repeat protein n=1 Tax=Flavobacterium sp. Sd200 TaxID=2692211 RepID=UPI00136DFC14|nr:tetratricopeptide repeat protein [Flavobacterium sp. Sd200]MXN90751.1 tetratricopeptide repeat protein [Flavobacterium sp. Sd200]